MLSKKRILIFVVNGILRMFGKNNFTLISSILSEEITPVIDIVTTFGKISFYCHGEVPLIRARTLLTKEPETILWIDDFNKDDVFWDVGANIGPYSLYAAKRGSFLNCVGNP